MTHTPPRPKTPQDPPSRRTPLKRKTPLRSHPAQAVPAMRDKPLKRTPFKRKAPQRKGPTQERSVAIRKNSIPTTVRSAVRGRSRGNCEFVSVSGLPCINTAEAMHHILMRSAGGKHEVDNLLDVCNEHHRYIHAHPRLAYEQGWLRRRSV